MATRTTMLAEAAPTQRADILQQLDNLAHLVNNLRMRQAEAGVLRKDCGIELDVVALLRDEVSHYRPERAPSH